MKVLAGATFFLVLGAFAGALVVSCAEPPRPANSAQNQAGAAPNADMSNPAAAANKDGGGGGGW